MKYEMQLLIHFQTSTVQLFKFEGKLIISSHNLLGMIIEVPFSVRGLLRLIIR